MREGILLIDKPSGMTSHDVVVKIRKKLKFKKIGHGGTLDPLATGLLIILIGKATKLSNRIISQDKFYSAELRLGFATDTADLDGKITLRAEDNGYLRIPPEKIREVFASFLGPIYQVPPMYSAIKYKGTPLYKLARRGITIPRQPRKVFVHQLEIEEINLPKIKFKIKCSRGLYIRKLAEDIGEKLGYPAHLGFVRRLAVGNFKIENAYPLDKILNMENVDEVIIPLYEVRSYLG